MKNTAVTKEVARDLPKNDNGVGVCMAGKWSYADGCDGAGNVNVVAVPDDRTSADCADCEARQMGHVTREREAGRAGAAAQQREASRFAEFIDRHDA